MAGSELLSRVDHLVYACAELERGIAEIEQVLGVRARLGEIRCPKGVIALR